MIVDEDEATVTYISKCKNKADKERKYNKRF